MPDETVNIEQPEALDPDKVPVDNLATERSPETAPTGEQDFEPTAEQVAEQATEPTEPEPVEAEEPEPPPAELVRFWRGGERARVARKIKEDGLSIDQMEVWFPGVRYLIETMERANG